MSNSQNVNSNSVNLSNLHFHIMHLLLISCWKQNKSECFIWVCAKMLKIFRFRSLIFQQLEQCKWNSKNTAKYIYEPGLIFFYEVVKMVLVIMYNHTFNIKHSILSTFICEYCLSAVVILLVIEQISKPWLSFLCGIPLHAECQILVLNFTTVIFQCGIAQLVCH